MKRRDTWFEFSWLGGWYPVSWEGLLALVGGVGGFLALTFTGMEMARRTPGSALASIAVGLAFLDIAVFFYLLFTRTRTRRQAREDEANHTARQLFRTPD